MFLFATVIVGVFVPPAGGFAFVLQEKDTLMLKAKR